MPVKMTNWFEEKFYADLINRRSWQLVDAYKERVAQERKDPPIEVDSERMQQDALNFDFDLIEVLERRKHKTQQSVLKLLLQRFDYVAQGNRIVQKNDDDTKEELKNHIEDDNGDVQRQNSADVDIQGYAQVDRMPAKNDDDETNDKHKNTQDDDEQNQKQESPTDGDDDDDHDQEEDENEDDDAYDDHYRGGDTEEDENDDGEECYEDDDCWDIGESTSEDEREERQFVEKALNENMRRRLKRVKHKPIDNAANIGNVGNVTDDIFVNQSHNVDIHWSDLEDVDTKGTYYTHDCTCEDDSDYDDDSVESDSDNNDDDAIKADSFTKVD